MVAAVVISVLHNHSVTNIVEPDESTMYTDSETSSIIQQTTYVQSKILAMWVKLYSELLHSSNSALHRIHNSVFQLLYSNVF